MHVANTPSRQGDSSLFLGPSVTSKLSKTRPETALRTGLKGKGRGKGKGNMPTLKVKWTTTKHNSKLVHGENEAPASCWVQCFLWTPSPVRVLFRLCGLSWQPFDAHIFCPLVSEQSSHGRIFPSPQSPGLLVPFFIPRKRQRCSWDEPGMSREPGPAAVTDSVLNFYLLFLRAVF